MAQPSFECFVFVDFENVPEVDLGLLEGKPVHVVRGRHSIKLG